MSSQEQRNARSSIPRLRSVLSQTAVKLFPLPTSQYTPLSSYGQIRLLTVLPGRQGSIVKCRLAPANLEDAPRYEALSYTWGDPKSPENEYPTKMKVGQTFTIVVNGYHAKVGYNLESALQHLRLNTESRTLWVDALCIDQSNNKERSEQVRLMGKIYSQAFRVLCWLGESDKNAEIAFEAIEEICWAGKVAIWQYCSELLGVPPSKISSETFEELLASIPYSIESDSPFEAFADLDDNTRFFLTKSLSKIHINFWTSDLTKLARATFGESRYTARVLISGIELPRFINSGLRDLLRYRSYWKRLWVVQECLLAKEAVFVCGHHSLNLDVVALIKIAINVIVAAFKFMRNCSLEVTQTLYGSMEEIMSIYNKKTRSEQPSMDELIVDYSAKLSSEPRDAIYALLNVSSTISISVEYDKTVSDVYVEAARAMMRQRQSLDLICMAPSSRVEDARRSRDLALPSWVPNFGAGQIICGLSLIWTPIYTFFFPSKWPFENDGGISSVDHNCVLTIKGIFYGTVQCAYPRVSYSPTAIWQTVQTLKENFVFNSPTSSVNEPLWLTLFTDQYVDPKMGFSVRITKSVETKNYFTSHLEEALSLSKLPEEFLFQLKVGMGGKSFCTTTKGNFSQVLGDVEVGDHVFIARGATYPLILRPTTNDESFEATKTALGISTFYKFVGGAYVHGIMDGEVVEMIDGVTIKEETVHLI